MLNNGIELSWGGYNDAMPEFIRGTLQRIVEFQTNKNMKESTFNHAKEKLLLASKNFYLGNTYNLAMS
jgi:secreted Zn-dependent insulinase-like peptidase